MTVGPTDLLIICGLIGVGFYILLSTHVRVTFMKDDLERLEKNVSNLDDNLRDLQAAVRSMQVDVSILERGQARLNDTFPEMRSAVRNLKVDMAAVKRWS